MHHDVGSPRVRLTTRTRRADPDEDPLVAAEDLLDQRHIREGRRSGAIACGLALLKAGGRSREAARVGVAAVTVGRIATQQVERRDVAVRDVTERAVIREAVVDDRIPIVVKQTREVDTKEAEVQLTADTRRSARLLDLDEYPPRIVADDPATCRTR